MVQKILLQGMAMAVAFSISACGGGSSSPTPRAGQTTAHDRSGDQVKVASRNASAPTNLDTAAPNTTPDAAPEAKAPPPPPDTALVMTAAGAMPSQPAAMGRAQVSVAAPTLVGPRAPDIQVGSNPTPVHQPVQVAAAAAPVPLAAASAQVSEAPAEPPAPVEAAAAATPIALAPTPVAAAQAPQNNCAEPFKDANWYPGLPSTPSATPIYTDVENDAAKGLRFTDSAQDDVMALAVQMSNQLPSKIDGYQANSRNFSKRIIDVAITADTKKTGLVKVQIAYAHPNVAGAETVDLRGRIEHLNEKRADIKLMQVSAKGKKLAKTEFGGVLTCADLDQGCSVSLLRVDRLNKAGKIVSTAFMVYRWNDVAISVADYERQNYARLQNTNYSALAENLTNQQNNSCVMTLNDMQLRHVDANDCSLLRMQSECAGESMKSPTFQAIGFHSWAAAYGRAGLEFTFDPKWNSGLAAVDAKDLTISGPMVRSTTAATVNHALQVSNGNGVQSAQLVNNDGGGNFNVQFNFAGTPEAHMRVSLTNGTPPLTILQALHASLQLMPSVKEDDVAVAAAEDLK